MRSKRQVWTRFLNHAEKTLGMTKEQWYTTEHALRRRVWKETDMGRKPVQPELRAALIASIGHCTAAESEADVKARLL